MKNKDHKLDNAFKNNGNEKKKVPLKTSLGKANPFAGTVGISGEPGDKGERGIPYAGDTKNVVVREETTKKLSYRMYGLVPYNISPIQQAIQYGHAVVEYSLLMNVSRSDKGYDGKSYMQWAKNDKTFIILNGGTTNTNPQSIGTLNMHRNYLDLLEVPNAAFYEPDLGDQLTAVVFLVDERVYDRENYPEYENFDFEEQLEEDYYANLFGNDWKHVLELRNFLSAFKLA